MIIKNSNLYIFYNVPMVNFKRDSSSIEYIFIMIHFIVKIVFGTLELLFILILFRLTN